MTPRPPMSGVAVDPMLWTERLLKAAGFTDDSRQVKPGYACALIACTASDKAVWAKAAATGGAAVIFHDPETGDLPADLSHLGCAIPGLQQALSAMAALFYGDASASLQVFGVTGTNGKTSCAHWVAQGLALQGQRCGVIGTLGAGFLEALQPTGFTTPGPIAVQGLLADLKAKGAKSVAMEVSSHALAEARVDAVQFDVALLTNVSRDHLDYHGSLEAYAESKAQLFHTKGLQCAVLNLDDAFGQSLNDKLKASDCTRVTYSAEGRPADYEARKIQHTPEGLQFQIVSPKGERLVQAALRGRFNVSNLLGVAASLEAMGLDFEGIPEVLGALKAPAGRMETLTSPKGVHVVIDYAHTPDALEQVLLALRFGLEGRLIAVFGCGGDRDAGKRAAMGEVAERFADLVILTSDNPRSEDPILIMGAVVSGMQRRPYGQMMDRELAIRQALAIAEPGDVVLVAGKGHEPFQEIKGVRYPFSDRQKVLAVFDELGALPS